MMGRLSSAVFVAICLTLAHSALAQPHAFPAGLVDLRVDHLSTPLGIDEEHPAFSWKIDDPTRGARQLAYEVRVATTPGMQGSGADIWSSGRIDSGESIHVAYSGPALRASTRYFWSVQVWGANGRRYGMKQSWFETGLMHKSAWNGDWIGFETREEAAVRHAGARWIQNPDFHAASDQSSLPQRFAYRTQIDLAKPIQRATFYATGEDTVSAWVNGRQVLQAQPFPTWRQMPWKKYVKSDVTGALTRGANALAMETKTYTTSPAAPPAIATLYVEYADGTTATFSSDSRWKASAHAPQGWESKNFDSSSWKNAVEYHAAAGAMDAQLGNPWIPDSVKALRHQFPIVKPIRSARIYSTALGMYELFLNGQRVSGDFFAPGWTDYRERVTYQTYDVTHLLHEGENGIGALLAPGWYSTPLEWFQQPNNYGSTPPALRAMVRIEHTDGSVEWVSTSPDWQAHTSQILSSELYDGETQDATRPVSVSGAWALPDGRGAEWPHAFSIHPKPIEILAQDFQPIRVEREMPARKMTEPRHGVYIFDFGQNMAAVERIRVSGPRGTVVQVRFGEILNADGTLYTANLRTAKATDHFILAGTGKPEEFQAQFTFHGFRYAEITGLPSAPDLGSIVALPVHTAAPFTAELKTGSDLVNKLWSAILWGQRSNFVGIPTDCPQRDERLGWMADAQVFWRTASYNMSLAPFTRKFSRDMRGTQFGTPMYGIYSPGVASENAGFGPGWSDAGVIIPWTAWLQTGDTSVIEQNWDAMTKYVAAVEKNNPDWLWARDSGIPFGDWLAPEGRTNQVLIATAEWASDVTMLRDMAQATGRAAEAEKYASDFQKIKAAFQKKFVREDGTVLGADHGPNLWGERTHDPKAGVADTQTGYVLALHMNLMPENLRAAAGRKLASKIHENGDLLATGFLGTPYLLEELTKTGHVDLAYKLLLNTGYPSWGHVITHGGTTMWERWNSDQMKDDPAMNSFNHYAYGAVGDWIYRYAAGVDATPLDAGFHTIRLHPHFDPRLGSVYFVYDSVYGKITSNWKIDGKTAIWRVTIPANTTGWLDLSTGEARKWKIDDQSLEARGLQKETRLHGERGYELPSGPYEFEVLQ